MDEFFKQEGYDLVGAAMEVYNQVGQGFHEEVYQECLELELAARRIPFIPQPDVALFYKGRELRKRYKPDLIVFEGILAELKALKALTSNEEAQLLNYLHASHKRVGYLLNFGSPTGLEWKRFVL